VTAYDLSLSIGAVQNACLLLRGLLDINISAGAVDKFTHGEIHVPGSAMVIPLNAFIIEEILKTDFDDLPFKLLSYESYDVSEDIKNTRLIFVPLDKNEDGLEIINNLNVKKELIP